MRTQVTVALVISAFGFCHGLGPISYNKYRYEEFCYEDYGVNIMEYFGVRSSDACAFFCGQVGLGCVSFAYRYNTSLCQLKDMTMTNLTTDGCPDTDLAVYGEPTTEDPLRNMRVTFCTGGPCTNNVHGHRLCDGGGPGICNPYQGRVEVLQPGGGWGTVCDDSWTTSSYFNAQVTCKIFGYPSGTPQCCAYYGLGTLPILMDDVRCNSPDIKKLEDCTRSAWGSHNCGHYEDSSVTCDPY